MPSTPPPTAEPRIFLGRQPVLDRQQGLYAYKLLFRDGHPASGNCARIDDPTQASATVITNAFAELATHRALGQTRCIVVVDRELLFSEVLEALPAQRVVLDILERVAPTPEVIERCRQLRALGLGVVIDGTQPTQSTQSPGDDAARRALLAQADIVKVAIANSDAARLPALVGELKSAGRLLLAETVETHEQFELCRRAGFDLFQGYHFARPTVLSGRRLNPSQLALLRLLALVIEDAETGVIEDAFKREPGLAVNLLRLTNSVSCGLSMRITSLRHAITILGRRQLQRWLQLLVYTGVPGSAATSNPLLQLAATRGRLMELLVGRLRAKDRELADQAFMVGILSLMPPLLGAGIDELLEHLPVAPRVRQALADHDGVLGHLLRLAEASESADAEVLAQALCRPPMISAEALDAALAQALAWAGQLGDETAPEHADG